MPIQDYDYEIVALTENCAAIHLITHQPITLKRGQMGTEVMMLDSNACLVDFTDAEGITYAMETIPNHMLLRIVQEVEAFSA